MKESVSRPSAGMLRRGFVSKLRTGMPGLPLVAFQGMIFRGRSSATLVWRPLLTTLTMPGRALPPFPKFSCEGIRSFSSMVMEINYVHKGIIDSLVISYRIVVKLTCVYLLLLPVIPKVLERPGMVRWGGWAFKPTTSTVLARARRILARV
mgnify:CR=1 FL=1